MRLHSALVTSLVAFTLATGCGTEDDENLLDLRSGDSLLDHPGAAQLEVPAVTVAPDVAAALRGRPEQLQVRLRAEDWIGGDELAAYTPDLLAHMRSPRVWQPRRQPDLAGGTLSGVSLAGRELASPQGLGLTLEGGLVAWRDTLSGALVIWAQETRAIVVVSDERPTILSLRFDVEPDRLARLGEVSPDPGNRLLGRSRAFGGTHRRSLRIDAPGRAVWRLRQLSTDTLDVAVGLPGRGLITDDGDLVQLISAGDGAEVAVEIRVIDGEQPRLDDASPAAGSDGSPPQVAWQRALAPGEGWVEDQVDLSPWLGQDVELRLVSAPGPAGDAAFDEVVWAGLRLRGETDRVPDRPHVVIVDIDTLRADRMSLYGYERKTTPGIAAWHRRWRDRAVVFTDCVSAASWTLPSTLSLLTGLAPHQHGVDHGTQALGDSAVTLAERLGEAGYETRGYVEAGMVSGALGFAQGFDVYTSSPHQATDWDPALAWLDQRRSERPFLLFLQTYRVHSPHAHDLRFEPADEPYSGPFAGLSLSGHLVVDQAQATGVPLTQADRDHLDRLYDAGIHTVDRLVSKFLEELDARFGPEQVLVIITSDHGEEFFDHGATGHGQSLHAELLQVPLIVRFPEIEHLPESGRSSRPVSLLDIVPTVLDVAGLAPAADTPGVSVRDLLDGPPRIRPRVARRGDRAAAIEQDGFKLIVSTTRRPEPPRLFDLGRDPNELDDVADEYPERVAALRDLLEQYLARYPSLLDVQQSDLDTAALEAMQALGYLGEDR